VPCYVKKFHEKIKRNTKKEIETDLTSAPLREPIGSQISAERTRFPEM
jgi:hypothetical protein